MTTPTDNSPYTNTQVLTDAERAELNNPLTDVKRAAYLYKEGQRRMMVQNQQKRPLTTKQEQHNG